MRAAAAMVVATVAVALGGGCGDDEEPDPVAEAEVGIAAVVAERLDAKGTDVAVDCPAELELAPGTEFACAITVAGAEPVDVALAVTADGAVELRRAVIPTAAAEAYLAAELAGPAESPVEPDCGDTVLLVADVGDDLRCQVIRASDGSVYPVILTVLSLDGTVRYRVEPTP